MRAELSPKDKNQAPLSPQFEWIAGHITASQITGLPRIPTHPFTQWPTVHPTPMLTCDPMCHRASTPQACTSRASMDITLTQKFRRRHTTPGNLCHNPTRSIGSHIRITRHKRINPRWITPALPRNISRLSHNTSPRGSRRKCPIRHHLSVRFLVTCVHCHSIASMT